MSHATVVYPHNDLFNLAHYQRENINNKVAQGIDDGLGLDCMGCLISIAFSVEALVNFIGHIQVDNWQETERYHTKIEKVCETSGIEFDRSTDPFQALWELKKIRDSIAHGQPIEALVSVSSVEELQEQMECPWDLQLNPDFVNHTYEQAQNLKRALFKSCDISVEDALTSADVDV